MIDLAPSIYRQRLVIEAYPKRAISAGEITLYLAGLAPVLDMKALIEPVTHRSEAFGWASWTHWETSGAHFYAWEQPILFYSVDIYTCKAFDPLTAVEYTRDFFDSDDAVYKEF